MFNRKVLGLLILIFIIVIVFFVVNKLINNEDKLLFEGQIFNESYIKITNLNDKSNLYSQFSKVIYISKKNKKYNLEKALNDGVLTFDYLFSKSYKKEALNDGGTTIYYFNDDFSNQKFEIVKCNTKDGIKDIYFTQNVDMTNTICINR